MIRADFLATAIAIVISGPALADGVFKDREQLLVDKYAYAERKVRSCGSIVRRTNCSADYVGSEMGLGKPSYYGTRSPENGFVGPR